MGFLDKFKKKPKTSPGGSPIYRYEETGNKGWRPPKAYGTYAEEITAHFEALFPRVITHELRLYVGAIALLHAVNHERI